LVEQEDENNVNEEDQLQQLLNSCEASNIISPPSPKRAETHLPHFPGNSNTPSKKQRVLLFGLVFFCYVCFDVEFGMRELIFYSY